MKKYKLVLVEGWIAEVSSTVKHSLTAATLCQVYFFGNSTFCLSFNKRSGKIGGKGMER